MSALLTHFQSHLEPGGPPAPVPSLVDAKDLAARLGLSMAQMSAHWSHRPLSNKAKELCADHADAVFNCAQAVAHCLRAKLETTWLTQPTPLLRKRIPLALLQTMHGTAFVLVAIERATKK